MKLLNYENIGITELNIYFQNIFLEKSCIPTIELERNIFSSSIVPTF